MLKERCIFILFFAWISTLFPGFICYGQTSSDIELQNGRLPITPNEFYIAKVVDARKDNTTIGQLIPVSPAQGKKLTDGKVDLKGGISAIKNFISYSLPVNKNLHTVIFRLKMLKVAESRASGWLVNGQVTLAVSFDLQRGEDLIHLTDYKSNAAYQRNAGPAQQIEPLLRGALNNSLIFLNNWMNAQAVNNIKLAKGVKVTFNDYTEPVEGDTIYYNIDRPLKWTDFQQRPQINSRHGAEIFASLGYNERVELIKGVINIRLDLKVYAPKSACWVREDVTDAYNLNHEQRHFDIVKLVAEHFKQAIKAEKLGIANYDGPINVAYFDALREINKLQKLYDTETGHSTNAYQQQQWNNKIDKELQELGIKPNSI